MAKRKVKYGIRRFILNRAEDVSGLSGTGVVAEGVEFSSGVCVVTWKSEYRSVTVHESLKSVEAVHGHAGATKVEWLDQ